MCIKHHKTSYVICIYRAENGTGAFRKKHINGVVPNYLQKNMITRGDFLNFTCLTLLGCKTRSLMRTCTTALLTLVMESGEKLETNSTNNPQNVYVAGMMIAKSVW